MITWYITTSACAGYARAMRWAVNVEQSHSRARDELPALLETATHKDTDAHGRELWRCSKRLGRGLRVVVEPTKAERRVLWVGHGVPPRTVWGNE